VDLQVVQEVVRTLRARGERVSVRAVHGVTGGSFRDVSRLLREVREFLDDDELASLDGETEAPEPVESAPRLGRIPQAWADLQAANARLETERLRLGERRQRLRDLQNAGPAPVTHGVEVDDYLEAKNAHNVEVFHEADAVKYQGRIVAQCEAERYAFQTEHARLLNLAQTFRDSIIAEKRQTLADLQQRQRQLRGDLDMVERQVERTQRELTAYEAELRGLLGE
jgi:Plasmid replication region DNA-binding N-term